MKIGILTFHCAYNYGAMLQCFALQEYLINLGYNVEIINYRPNYLLTKNPKLTLRTFISRSPIHLYRKIRVYLRNLIFVKKFKKFENTYYNLSSCDLSNITSEFDCIILGSDQIWNTKYNGNDNIWYGYFSSNIKCRVISYAASAGTPNFNSGNLDFIIKQINKLSYVSVREDILKRYLSKYTRKNIDVVLDPTLLLPVELWNKLKCRLGKRFDKRFILVHQARKDDNVFRIAKDLSKELNCKIIATDMYGNSFNEYSEHVIMGPDEFFELLKKSVCVVTTSFHITALSIINNKDFYSLKLDDGSDERIEQLLKSLNLMSRFIDKISEIEYEKIDYSKVNIELNRLRIISQRKLKQALYNNG